MGAHAHAHMCTHAQTHAQHHEKLKVGIRQMQQKKGTPKMDDRNPKREERWEDKFSQTSDLRHN